MTPSATRLSLVVAVMVTASLLVSPVVPAAVASALCWLAVLAAHGLAPAVATAGHIGGRPLPEPDLPHRHSTGGRWPDVSRALLTGLLLTLVVLGASWALLARSWEGLLETLVLFAATVPWWLPAAEQSFRGTQVGRAWPSPEITGPAEEARADAELMRWHSRRRVAAVILAVTVGVTGTLTLLGLFVISDAVVTAGPGPSSGYLTRMSGCHLTGATFAPVVATTSAIVGTAAVLATAAARQMRPAPQPGAWQLAAWCALGVALALVGVSALGAWWLC